MAFAVSNAYVALADLKAWAVASGSPTWSANDDSNMSLALNAISRALDAHFGTRFYGSTETRTYTAEWPNLLYIDDLATLTTLKTDDDDDGTYETTWTTADYRLEPANAQINTAQPKPYRQIRVKTSGSYSFPVKVQEGVQIVGVFGYQSSTAVAATVPWQITAATMLMAQRLWKRREAIFGVAGAPAVGVQMVIAEVMKDSDVMFLLDQIPRRIV